MTTEPGAILILDESCTVDDNCRLLLLCLWLMFHPQVIAATNLSRRTTIRGSCRPRPSYRQLSAGSLDNHLCPGAALPDRWGYLSGFNTMYDLSEPKWTTMIRPHSAVADGLKQSHWARPRLDSGSWHLGPAEPSTCPLPAAGRGRGRPDGVEVTPAGPQELTQRPALLAKRYMLDPDVEATPEPQRW